MVFALCAAIYLAFGLWNSNLIEDDAFIFFRYVDNFLHGDGLTWNPGGEKVEGYSSFLWVLVLAIPRAFGFDPVSSSQFLNGFFLLGTILACSVLVKQVQGKSTWAVIIAPILLGTSASFTKWSRLGMESMLFAMVATIAVTLTLRRSTTTRGALTTGVVHGALVLVRPEGFLISLVCLGWAMMENRRKKSTMISRTELLWMGGFAAVIVPHLAWRIHYYGEWVPNTYYAKVGFRMGILRRGLVGFFSFLASQRGVLASLAVISWAAVSKDQRKGGILVVLLGLWVVYLTFILGLPRWDLWYTMPVDLFSLLLLALAVSSMIENMVSSPAKRESRKWLWLVATVGILMNASGAIENNMRINKGFGISLSDPVTTTKVNEFTVIGKVLKSIADKHDTIAVGACGAIPYYSGLTTFDVLGLNDRHIAHTTFNGPVTDAFGHEKGDGRYILSQKPTILIPLPILTARPSKSHAGFEKSFIEIYGLPQFRENYEFQYSRITRGPFTGRFFNYWKLKQD
jgi:hypothetical protein